MIFAKNIIKMLLNYNGFIKLILKLLSLLTNYPLKNQNRRNY